MTENLSNSDGYDWSKVMRPLANVVLLTKTVLIGFAAGGLLGALVGIMFGGLVFGLAGAPIGALIGGFTGGPIAGIYVFLVVLTELIRRSSKRNKPIFIILGGVWSGGVLALPFTFLGFYNDTTSFIDAFAKFNYFFWIGFVCGLVGAAIINELGAPKPIDTLDTEAAFAPTWPMADNELNK